MRGGELGSDAGKQLGLGAGRVVLGQLGDRLEQLRAARIVEPLRRDGLRPPRQAVEHVASEGVGILRCAGFVPERVGRRVVGQPHAGEHPALVRVEEVAVAGARVAVGRNAGAAAQGHLAHHELAVVFADGAAGRLETRVTEVGAGGPLPGGVVELDERLGPGHRRVLPLRLGGQPLAGPGRVGVGLVVADVQHRRVEVERLQAHQAHRAPAGVAARPVERRLPAFKPRLPRPAVQQPYGSARA